MYANILNTTGSYNQTEIDLFNAEAKKRFICKDEILLKEGEIARSVYFLVSGDVYQASQMPMPNDITNLHIKNEWFLNEESFVLTSPSVQRIIAFSESIVLEISIESIHYLISKSNAFLQLNTILINRTTSYLRNNALTPIEKYQYLLDNKPQLIQKFPLKMIASYLSITPETLSRVRSALVRIRS